MQIQRAWWGQGLENTGEVANSKYNWNWALENSAIAYPGMYDEGHEDFEEADNFQPGLDEAPAQWDITDAHKRTRAEIDAADGIYTQVQNEYATRYGGDPPENSRRRRPRTSWRK